MRRQGFSEGSLCSLTGSTIPLARDAAARERTKDPRPSLAERYPTKAGYVAVVAEAADRLVADRLLLPADAQRFKDAAAQADLGATP
ncbi:MAG: hypothetical protein FJX52_14630 [Alphaproteobacteria bacterium]|nr:hypothetical protein [Alphaproteobacteria bacterium]